MSIADKITSIETHLENDYEGLENLGVTAEDRNIENIRACLDELYNNIPKTTDTGTNLSLTTLKGKMNIIPKGDTKQTTYNGYNKINCSMDTKTTNGVTATHNADGTYTINGTATANVYFDLCFFELPAGTYKLVGCPSGGSWSSYIQYVRRIDNVQFDLNDTGNGSTITTTGEEGQLRLSIMIYSGYTANNLVFKPMVTTNTSLSYNDYEPYVGGTASPNPTYPQDIEVVTGTQEVKVENVNLFVCRTDITIGQSGTRDGITWKRTGENTFLFNGTATANFTFIIDKPNHLLENLRKSDTYTLSGCPSGGSSSTYRLQIYHSNLTSTTIDTGEGKSFTANIQSESNVAILIYNGYTANNLEFNVQIEKGSTKTTFAPHQEQTQTISLSSKNYVTNTWQRTTTTSSSIYRIFSSVQLPITSGAYKVITNLDFTNYWYALEVGSTTYPFQANLYDSGWKAENNVLHTITQNGYVGILVRKKNDTSIDISDMQNFKFELVDNSEEYYNYELCKIGNYQDYLYKTSGKQMLDLTDGTYSQNGITAVVSNGGITLNGTATTNAFIDIPTTHNYTLENNETYTIATNNPIASQSSAVRFRVQNSGTLDVYCSIANAIKTFVYNTGDGFTNKVMIRVASGVTLTNYFLKPMLVKGSTIGDYEPYGSDIWYKKENVYKIANKTNWSVDNVASNNRAVISLSGNGFPYSSDIGYATANAISNNFVGISQLNQASTTSINNIAINNANMYIKFDDTINTKALVKEQLDSMTSLEVYYVLATSNDIQITNTNLIEQLDNLEKLMSYNGTTNISSSGNLPMVLSVSAIKGE